MIYYLLMADFNIITYPLDAPKCKIICAVVKLGCSDSIIDFFLEYGLEILTFCIRNSKKSKVTDGK